MRTAVPVYPTLFLFTAGLPVHPASPVFLSNRSRGEIAICPWPDGTHSCRGEVLFRLREDTALPAKVMPQVRGEPLVLEQILKPGATMELALEQDLKENHVSLYRIRRVGVPDRRDWNFRYSVVLCGKERRERRATIMPSGFGSARRVFESPGPDLDHLVFRGQYPAELNAWGY